MQVGIISNRNVPTMAIKTAGGTQVGARPNNRRLSPSLLGPKELVDFNRGS